MRKLKNKLPILLVLILLLASLPSYALANTSEISDNKIAIKEFLNEFFKSKAINFQNEQNINLSNFFASDKSATTDKQYFIDKETYYKALYKNENISFKYYDSSINIRKMDIENENAYVTVYELTSYLDLNGNGLESQSGIEYEIELKKDKDKWKIVKINSPNDIFDHEFYESDFNLNILLEEFSQICTINKSITADNIKLFGSTRSLSSWAYGRAYAADYAYRYALNYCSHFDDHSSDCQNFASQCVYYGYLRQHGGYLTSNNVENRINPMVYKNANEDWYQTGPSTSYETYSWQNVDGFADLIDDSSNTIEGPGGWINSTGVSWADMGDILQIRDSSGDYYHSFVVYTVTGTAGSRTLNNIWVCAHTNDRKNVQLSTLISDTIANRNNFKTVRIGSGHYN